MRRLHVLLLLSVISAVVACRGGVGDTGDSAESAGEPEGATAQAIEQKREPIALVRSSLRAVAGAQETYWQEHQTYTTDLEVLKEIPGCKIQENVTVRIAEAAENGFAMEATHPDFIDRSCVQWYGKPGSVGSIATALEGKRGDESPGRVICDTPQTG